MVRRHGFHVFGADYDFPATASWPRRCHSSRCDLGGHELKVALKLLVLTFTPSTSTFVFVNHPLPVQTLPPELHVMALNASIFSHDVIFGGGPPAIAGGGNKICEASSPATIPAVGGKAAQIATIQSLDNALDSIGVDRVASPGGPVVHEWGAGVLLALFLGVRNYNHSLDYARVWRKRRPLDYVLLVWAECATLPDAIRRTARAKLERFLWSWELVPLRWRY